MYLLRRYFGISWHEAEHVIPDWEVTSLLNTLNTDLQGEGR